MREGSPDVKRMALAQMESHAPPLLSEREAWYIACFDDLDFDRPIHHAGANMPIPTMAILTYANHLGLSDSKRALFLQMIRMIDLHTITYRNDHIRAHKPK